MNQTTDGRSSSNSLDPIGVATDLEQIRGVLDVLPQLAWSCLPNGHCDYLSRRWVEYTGVPELEHHGRGWLDAVHAEDRRRTREGWEAFIAGRGDYDVDYRLRRHDGAYLWFKTRGVLVKDAAGNPIRVVGTTTDIDAQKSAESRSAAILESISDAFFALDRDWRFTYVNHEAERLLGRTRDELVGKTLWIEFAPTLGTDFERSYRRAADSNMAVNFEAFYPPHDRWYEVNAYPSHAGLSVYFRDINDRKRAEVRQRFFADLAAATQPLTNPDDVTAMTARLLAEHLGVDRCAYAAIEDEAVYVITGDYTRGVPSIVGRWPIKSFGAEHHRVMLANEPYVVHDAETDPRIGPTDLQAYRATNIQAVICVPLHKDGRLTAAMAVHQSRPRTWLSDEVDLVRTVVNQCWEALQRARAALLLREGDEQLQLITDSVPALIAIVGADQRYRFVNRQYEEWFGRPRSEFEGKHISEVVGAAAYERLKPFIERGLAGERFEFESFAPYPTGHRYIHAAFVPRRDGEHVAGYLSLITDVTARVEAQQQLEASEERFRAFMDHSPAAAWITDAAGTVRYVSAAYSRLFKLPTRELVGSSPTDLYPEEFASEYVRNIRLVAESGKELETIERAPRPDGTIGQFLVYKFPLPGGEWVGGVAIDVTERLRAEEQLRDADRRKDEFLALLAHELRNPLAPLRNGLQVMQLAGTNSIAGDQARVMMERQLSHLVRMVDDLLDVSRISRNKMELRRDRVLLSDVVSSAVETARPLIDAGKHQFSASLPTEPVYLNADLTRLAQVFSNLLSNAAKYTPSGGRLSLNAEIADAEVTISIRDNGIGIPTEALPTLFDMFSQVDRSLERSTGGLGIGLALVKGLVEMHGGRVAVDSEGPGKGSTFTVVLPREPSGLSQADQDNRNTAATPGVQARRILVVDDNRDSANSMATLLSLLGHDVKTAHDGIDAVATAEAFRPDVILMDIGMPRLNGYDATRRIREQTWAAKVTIVAVTGWGQEGDRQQSRSAGCDGHLVKPVHLSDLLPFLSTSTSTQERGR